MDVIISENYLCFATLIEMVLRDSGINDISRFYVAEQLGITLPTGYSKLNIAAKYSDDIFEQGIKIEDNRLNTFFKENNICLHAEYYHATPFTMLEEEFKHIHFDYVIFLFSYGELMHKFNLKDVGHVALYMNNIENGKIDLYDPGPDNPGIKTVNCYELEEAMYQRRGGYLTVSRIKKYVNI